MLWLFILEKRMIQFTFTILSTFSLLYGTHSAKSDKHHNVLLLIADDLGIGDIGCYGSTQIKTPNLDLLAKDGIKFNSMYSVQSDAGSMAAILTGFQPRRLGLVKSKDGWDTFWSLAQTGGIPSEHFHLGRLFSSHRIKSFFTGRWNLGFQSNEIPTASGFGSFYGNLISHGLSCTKDKKHKFTDNEYFWAIMAEKSPIFISILLMIIMSKLTSAINIRMFVCAFLLLGVTIIGIRIYCWTSFHNPSSCISMEDNVIIEQPYNEDRLTLRMTNHAIQVLKYWTKPSEPFLFVMSYPQPGFPSMRSYLFNNRSGHGPYYDAVMEMDWSIGKILKTLQDRNLANNTLVIFVSDNGQQINHPITKEHLAEKFRGSNLVMNAVTNQRKELRGGKGSVWEGGIRVPAIMRLPGVIKPGSETNIITSVMDSYPTIYQHMGFSKSSSKTSPDGKSLFPVFDNPKRTPSNVLHEHLYHYCDLGHVAAVTVGDIKIQFTDGKLDDCSGPILDNPLIFNISADPGESESLDVRSYKQLIQHVKASVKQYEVKKGIRQITYSQFDEIPNPLNFPCTDIMSCHKEYEYDDNFHSILP